MFFEHFPLHCVYCLVNKESHQNNHNVCLNVFISLEFYSGLSSAIIFSSESQTIVGADNFGWPLKRDKNNIEFRHWNNQKVAAGTYW